MTEPFAAAFAEGDPATLAAECLAQLPDAGRGANLGILYVSEPAAPVLPYIVQELAKESGIAAWVGGVGLGVCGAGREVYGTPAAAMLAAR
ncbi:MAG TPA: histidine kinase, partial [Stellaceae bacterium]|nr:histidine kinase [Stellaceae bacterium]